MVREHAHYSMRLKGYYLCRMKVLLSAVLFFSLTAICFAQHDFSTVHIHGRVVDPDNTKPDLTTFMVVNMTTQHGFFGNADGTFSLDINRSDTIVVAVTGYDYQKYNFNDSVPKPSYELLVRLRRKEVTLPEIRIIAPRD